MHLLVPRAPDSVDGQLEHEHHRLARALVGQLCESTFQAFTGLRLPAEEAFDPRTCACEPGADRVRLVRHDRNRLEQGDVAVGETARRGQRLCAREQ